MFPKITIDYDEYRVQLAHKDIVNLGHHIFSLMTIDDIKALIAAAPARHFLNPVTACQKARAISGF